VVKTVPPSDGGWQPMRKGLVAICFKAVQAGRGHGPVLVKQNGLQPMRKGLKRKSRRICMGLVAILQSKIVARPCNLANPRNWSGKPGFLRFAAKNAPILFFDFTPAARIWSR
jgi:hypothetical protein